MTIKVIHPKWNYQQQADSWVGDTPLGVFVVRKDVRWQSDNWDVYFGDQHENAGYYKIASALSSSHAAKMCAETWYADRIMRSVEVKE